MATSTAPLMLALVGQSELSGPPVDAPNNTTEPVLWAGG